MGGFFGAASQTDCVFDLFFGIDYHSHLGTRRAGMAVYSPETGFACGVEEEALLKQTVLHRAEHVAVLLDSSKIDRRSTFRICGLDEVDTVISDGRLPPEFLSACENAGVKVL